MEATWGNRLATKKKLSDGEIINLFVQMEKNPECKNKTIEQLTKKLSYIPCSLSSKYSKHPNYNDIKQVAYETFFKAIKSFDYRKSSNFKSWAWWWIRKEVAVEALREKRFVRSYVPIDEKMLEESSIFYLEDCVIEQENEYLLKKFIGRLDEEVRFILESYYGIGDSPKISLRSIASKLNISHESVRTIKNEATNDLIRLCDPTV